MSKSMTIIIALLACCFGVFIGVLVMSSQVEKYKEQKTQSMIARTEAIGRLETLRHEKSRIEKSLRSELAKVKTDRERLQSELLELRRKSNGLQQKLVSQEKDVHKLRNEVKFLSESKAIINVGSDSLPEQDNQQERDIVKEAVEFIDYMIKLKDKEGIFNRVEAYFQFRNNSHKILTGLRYRVDYYDDFGDTLYKTGPIKHPMKVYPEQTNIMEDFCCKYWPIGEGYTELENSAKAGIIKVRVKIEQASFSDGSIIVFD